MRNLRLVLSIVSICALCGSASASKPEAFEGQEKQWRLHDVLPQLSLADTNEAEPNDSCPGNGYTPETTFHGTIASGGDQDWIRFSCTAGDRLTIGTDVDGARPPVDTVIELYSADCSTALASDDDSGPGLYSMIQDFAAPYTGDYNLRVRSFSTTANGDYVIQVSCSVPTGAGTCPVTAYETETMVAEMAIPDGDLAGVTGPAIQFAPRPSFVIADVVVSLEVSHTWLGDLCVTLRHTSPQGAERSAVLFDRPGVGSFGCSGEMLAGADYVFGSDPALDAIGDPACPALLSQGCYAVAPDPDALSVFAGMPAGQGTWEILVQDKEGGDEGLLHSWSLHILSISNPVSVESSSWGSIKAAYRRTSASTD